MNPMPCRISRWLSTRSFTCYRRWTRDDGGRPRPRPPTATTSQWRSLPAPSRWFSTKVVNEINARVAKNSFATWALHLDLGNKLVPPCQYCVIICLRRRVLKMAEKNLCNLRGSSWKVNTSVSSLPLNYIVFQKTLQGIILKFRLAIEHKKTKISL